MNKQDFSNIDKSLQEFIDYLDGKQDNGVTTSKFTVNSASRRIFPS